MKKIFCLIAILFIVAPNVRAQIDSLFFYSMALYETNEKTRVFVGVLYVVPTNNKDTLQLVIEAVTDSINVQQALYKQQHEQFVRIVAKLEQQYKNHSSSLSASLANHRKQGEQLNATYQQLISLGQERIRYLLSLP